MTADAGIAVGVVLAVFGFLAFTRLAPYIVLTSGMALLLVTGVLSPAEAFAGFANPGMVTIALLFVVAAGLRETGVINYIVRVLGRPTSVRRAQARLMPPVTLVSGFLNNTPLVAMLLPAVRDWAKRINVPASKLLIPLSYASILGGMCTLIGTSTNLVVHGLLIDSGRPGMGVFDVTLIGVPCALIGLLYLVLRSNAAIPDRDDVSTTLEDLREYTVEMVVEEGGPLVGKTVEAAGLRHLPNTFLAEIHRTGRVLPAVAPSERLEANDQLVFVGLVETVVDLQRTPGLKPASEQVFQIDTRRSERWFIEAVVSQRSPVVGKSIRDSDFRARYNAVILAVAREGDRLKQKIGDIVLEPGDVLLLEAPPRFVQQQRNATDFYLVGRAGDDAPPSHERAGIAMVTVIAMVVVAALGWVSMLKAALLAAGIIFLTRCASEETIRRAIDWHLLLAIAAAFGLGRALEVSGVAAHAADLVASTAAGDPWIAFAAICILTTLLSEFITNNAAAVLVFPIAMQTATALGVSYMPFAIGIMLAASASFATPLGYQTNLMVYGPGGYHFRDFIRIGLPMDLLMLLVIVAVTPLVWGF